MKYTYCPISQNLKAIRKTKWREEAFSRSFSKNWNWAYLWIKSRKSYNTVCFYLMPSWGLWILLKLSCRPLAFTSYKVFLETKRGLELVSVPHFLYDFWRKIFFLLYSINWTNFTALFLVLLEILGNMCIVFVHHIFIIFKLIFVFNQAIFFYMPKMLKQKFKYLANEKSF